MRRLILLLALIVVSTTGALPALAQECSLDTIVGTYAFRYTGDSFLGGMPAAPDAAIAPGVLPVHSAGLYAHGVIVGTITIAPDGRVNFKYWSTIGSWSSMGAGVAATGRIVDIGYDRTPDGVPLSCAGIVEYNPFGTVYTHRDKFFVLENGRELRTIPFETPAFPTVASLGVARRITRTSFPSGRTW